MTLRTITSLLVYSAVSLTAADPSGHWKGSVQATTMEVKIDVDLVKSTKGDLTGTLSSVDQKVTNVAVDGNRVSFQVKGMAGQRVFRGSLSTDGQSITGDYTQGDHSMPFLLTRTGEARIESAIRNVAIAKELEGEWNGTLDVDGKQSRLVLRMSNQPDGNATGSVVKIGEGLEIPAATITQKGSSLALDFKAVGASYFGSLSADGTELAGTLTQGSLVLPLIFRRAAAAEAKK